MNEVVSCDKCGFSASRKEMERLCCNCFACTGCERFTCPKCGNEIVVKPIQGFRLKKKEDTSQK